MKRYPAGADWRKSPLLGRLNEAELDWLRERVETRRLATGELLVREGEQPTHLFLIERGEADVLKEVVGNVGSELPSSGSRLRPCFFRITSTRSAMRPAISVVSARVGVGKSWNVRGLSCKENFLSHARVREWREVYRQLNTTVRELGLGRDAGRRAAEQSDTSPRDQRVNTPKVSPPRDVGAALHKALLSGLLSRIGLYEPERRVYVGARQTRFALHPSSALAKKPPAWVMAFELVETTRLFARMVAKVEPAWLAEVGAHLLQRRYSEPHWS